MREIHGYLPSLARRQVLVGLCATIGAPAIVRAQTIFVDQPFSLGVASGDPSSDGFVIWTRLAPRPLEPHGGMPMAVFPVDYEIAEDARFTKIIAKGQELARPELAHSVHAEVGGLQPNRPYWYRFMAGGERSNPGRARTLPQPGATRDRIRFVACGCQNYEDGYYTAYRHIADEDLDFVWHYGDYIYEPRRRSTILGADSLPIPLVREHVGDEIYSLDDYRTRYAQYKLDADLQAAHAAHSWWVTWDDHETDNNWAADRDQDGTPPEIFNLRRQASTQAYYEHMPLRRTAFPRGTASQIYRRADYGKLLDVHLLDTRQYRMDQPCGDGFKPLCVEAQTPDRTIMGTAEEKWLFEGLSRSRAQWKLIANQVMIMPLDRRTSAGGEPTFNLDSWAGYPAARTRLLNHVGQRGIHNVVVTTGDEHQNYAGELSADGGTPVAVEFVATSISSGGDGSDRRPGSDMILANNPHLKFINDQRGYILCDVDRQRWRTDYKVLENVRHRDAPLATRQSITVAAGEPRLTTS